MDRSIVQHEVTLLISISRRRAEVLTANGHDDARKFREMIIEANKLLTWIQNPKIKDTSIRRSLDKLNRQFDTLIEIHKPSDNQQKVTEIKPEEQPKPSREFSVSAPETGQAKLIMQRGGYREGAGRKRKGISKPVKVNLPEEEWIYIDELIANGHVESIAEYFRQIHLATRRF